MGKKKPPEPKNDFACEEDLDVCSFSEEPIITGKCIASFSFSDDLTDRINESDINISNNNIAASESTSTKTIAFNNSTTGNNNTHSTTNTDTNLNTSPASTPEVKKLANDKDILTDNRKTPIVNGCAPPIAGEYLDVKRTYMLRSSTVRKLNELKSISHDLNTYVSTIVDIAIAYYYDHVINNGSIQ